VRELTVCAAFVTAVEYRNGEKLEYSAGDTWIETADTVHWAKNPSSENKAVIFMVDLPPKE